MGWASASLDGYWGGVTGKETFHLQGMGAPGLCRSPHGEGLRSVEAMW